MGLGNGFLDLKPGTQHQNQVGVCSTEKLLHSERKDQISKSIKLGNEEHIFASHISIKWLISKPLIMIQKEVFFSYFL